MVNNKEQFPELPNEEEILVDLERLDSSGSRCTLELTPSHALTLLSNLQLALRHPGNIGLGAQVIRGLCDELIGFFDTNSPCLGALARAGDNPTYDR